MAKGVWGEYYPYASSYNDTKSYAFVDELTSAYANGVFGYTNKNDEGETYAKISQDYKTLSFYSKKYEFKQYNTNNVTYRYWVVG